MQTRASAASSRLEQILLRGYPVIALVLLAESFLNMLSQRAFLTTVSDIYAVVLFLSVLVGFVGYWRFEYLTFSIRVFPILIFLGIFLWPSFIEVSKLPNDSFQPWIWWLLGIGAVASALAFPFAWSLAYIFLASISWLVLHTFREWGFADLARSFQDSSYLFLISLCLIAVIGLLRNAARDADIANTEAISRAIELARLEALDRERGRLDALVHDRVLNALLAAAKASSKKDRLAAATLADQAILALTSAKSVASQVGVVNPAGLFQALQQAAERLTAKIEISIQSASLLEIPSEVATAITEATLQALDNAIRHADASKIQLELSAREDLGLLVRIRDDGKGFRPSRISKNRLGIQTSIIQRAKSVNARASVNSEPGRGTEVILEWQH